MMSQQLQEKEQEQEQEQQPESLECPLLARGRLAFSECGRGECAWWDAKAKQCGLLSMAHSLKAIQKSLVVIKSKVGSQDEA